MAAWKILLTDGLEEQGQAIMRASAQVDNREGISPDELLQIVGEYDAVIVRGRTKVTPAVFDAALKLKVVGRAGVGVDNINLDTARARGVTVVNSPTATTLAVAELTLGMMLTVVREIPRADAAMKNGRWLKKDLMGNELCGKTLGIIGFGRIGSAVAQRAAAFGMHISVNDINLCPEEVAGRGGRPVTLDELYAISDMITLHIPLTSSTRNLLNAASFEKMKQGVYIVCAARGGVIDEEALLAALNSGKVAGAALDVFVNEPPGETDLVKHPKVIAIPHVGAQTFEAQERAAVDIGTEVLAALHGEALRWKVA
ncbi:MAG TPA: hydroxyacid dehydrogenase [Levilinea sp.]|nr:hydroxyacid dehydrogenase [Levilinea sp.]